MPLESSDARRPAPSAATELLPPAGNAAGQSRPPRASLPPRSTRPPQPPPPPTQPPRPSASAPSRSSVARRGSAERPTSRLVSADARSRRTPPVSLGSLGSLGSNAPKAAASAPTAGGQTQRPLTAASSSPTTASRNNRQRPSLVKLSRSTALSQLKMADYDDDTSSDYNVHPRRTSAKPSGLSRRASVPQAPQASSDSADFIPKPERQHKSKTVMLDTNASNNRVRVSRHSRASLGSHHSQTQDAARAEKRGSKTHSNVRIVEGSDQAPPAERHSTHKQHSMGSLSASSRRQDVLTVGSATAAAAPPSAPPPAERDDRRSERAALRSAHRALQRRSDQRPSKSKPAETPQQPTAQQQPAPPQSAGKAREVRAALKRDTRQPPSSAKDRTRVSARTRQIEKGADKGAEKNSITTSELSAQDTIPPPTKRPQAAQGRSAGAAGRRERDAAPASAAPASAQPRATARKKVASGGGGVQSASDSTATSDDTTRIRYERRHKDVKSRERRQSAAGPRLPASPPAGVPATKVAAGSRRNDEASESSEASPVEAHPRLPPRIRNRGLTEEQRGAAGAQPAAQPTWRVRTQKKSGYSADFDSGSASSRAKRGSVASTGAAGGASGGTGSAKRAADVSPPETTQRSRRAAAPTHVPGETKASRARARSGSARRYGKDMQPEMAAKEPAAPSASSPPTSPPPRKTATTARQRSAAKAAPKEKTRNAGHSSVSIASKSDVQADETSTSRLSTTSANKRPFVLKTILKRSSPSVDADSVNSSRKSLLLRNERQKSWAT